MLAQSHAIARYLATVANLYPSNAEHAAVSDSIVDAVNDVKSAGYDAYYKKDAAVMAAFKETKLPYFLGKFETMLKNNGGNFFVGAAVTWTDLAVFELLEEMFGLSGELAAYPTLKAFKANMEQRPNLKDYVVAADRPKAYVLAALK